MAFLAMGIPTVPDSHCETTIALYAAPDTVWPTMVQGLPTLSALVPIIQEVFSTPHVLPASSVRDPFLQPFNWPPPQLASRLLTAVESNSPGLLPTTPSLIPSFIAPMPGPPQQHCDGVFYGGVDSIRASTTQLQVAARCLLAVVGASAAVRL